MNIKLPPVLAFFKVYYIELPDQIYIFCEKSSQGKIGRESSQQKQRPNQIKIENLETWKIINVVNTFCGCSFTIIIVRNSHNSRFDTVLFVIKTCHGIPNEIRFN